MKERKEFFKKNKGLMKRLFSFVLAVALVLNMGQIMPGSTVNAAEASGTHVTLHFNNAAWGWGAPAIQYWGGTSTTVTPKILQTLKDEGVHATFFITGQNLENGGKKAEDLLKQELYQ